MGEENKTKVIMLGNLSHGESKAIKHLKDHNVKIIEDVQEYFDVEVNGIKYIKTPKAKNRPTSGRVNSLIAMADMMMNTPLVSNRYSPDPPPKVNIVKEYALIQRKESNLSYKQRQWVIYQFEQTFTKI